MANLVIKLSDLKSIVEQAEEREHDTVVITPTSTVVTNNSGGKNRLGVHLGSLPFLLIDDPCERGYWKDVRYKFVLSKSNPRGTV